MANVYSKNQAAFKMLVALYLNKVSRIIMPSYIIYTILKSSVCIFNAVKKQSGIGFIVDALFGYFAYLHSFFTEVELHRNFVVIQSLTRGIRSNKV